MYSAKHLHNPGGISWPAQLQKTLIIPHEIDILVSYNVVMKSDDIQLPNTSSLTQVQYPAIFPARFSFMSYHHHKTGTLQSKHHSPFFMLHCQLLFPGLLLAVLSFLMTCHDRTVSIMITSFFLLLKLPFLIVLTYVLSDFLKTKLFSNSLPSPHHTCLHQLYLP